MTTGTDQLISAEPAALAVPAEPAAPAAPAAPATPADSWYAGMPAERHDYIKNKAWDGPGALLESYANLEKLAGVPEDVRAEQLLIVPKSDAKAEDVTAFLDKAMKVGVPADAAGYGFKAPEGVDPAQVEQGATWMHAAGVPKPIADKLMGQVLATEEANAKAFEAQSVKDVGDLQAEFGDKFDDTMELGRRAFAIAKDAGLDADKVQALEIAVGTKTMLKMFASFGRSLVEAPAPNGDPTKGGDQFRQTPEAAKAKIDSLYKDSEFMARYNSPNIAQRQKAIDEMEALQKVATGS